MTQLVVGTAHLYGLIDRGASDAYLDGARRSGLRRIDTAPSYGHGQSEVAVGELVGRDRQDWTVTTKVGIEAVAPPSGAVRAAKFLARRLPGSVQDRLRGDQPPGGGRFEPDTVAESLRRSLGRLGRIDRLMLHEVRVEDITPELLALLRTALRSGDVAAAGLATANALTAPCHALAPDVFSVVHFAVGLRAELPALPAGVVVVGHGALGAGGADFTSLAGRLERGDGWGARWREVTDGTVWAGRRGLADALLTRAATRSTGHGEVDEIIAASSRVDRVVAQRQVLDERRTLDDRLRVLLDEAATAPGS